MLLGKIQKIQENRSRFVYCFVKILITKSSLIVNTGAELDFWIPFFSNFNLKTCCSTLNSLMFHFNTLVIEIISITNASKRI